MFIHRISAPSLLVALVLATGLTSVSASEPVSPEARARNHIASFPARTFHGPDHSYHVRDVILDSNGAEHVRFDRRYKGLDVIGGDLVVHSTPRGGFSSASLTLSRWIDLPIQPAVKAPQATQAALARHPGDTRNTPPALVVYARGDLPALAWDVRVYGEQADGTPSEKHVIVDARGGQVLDAWDDIHTGSASGFGNSFFNGNNVALTTNKLTTTSYELRDPSRGNQYTINMGNKTSGGSIFKDADNLWGNGTLSDVSTVAVDAHYGTAMTWDYYLNVLGRNGIDGKGTGGYNRVHYSRNYANAFWSDNCFCMTYGDGNSSVYPLVSLDVTGHEMTHGVTSRTANLTYSGESGGLNEATSDIFGTMVEFYANNASDKGDYLIGEKLFKSGGYIRSMIQPSLDGVSADCWYTGVGNLDVHYSSGVANHFFHLLAEGTAKGSPTCVAGNTRVATGADSLTGIGKDKAAAIWYAALTKKMTSNTNYSGARAATMDVALSLYDTATQNAVAAAWAAVGVLQ